MGIALYTGVTGLLAHQQKLDVVANNIANVNTVGYRSGRMLFQDLFSQTLSGASAPDGTFGGTNPVQVGLGVQLASIDTNFEQGALQTTGIASDLAIQGSGFFVLNDGIKDAYTRDGSFTLNANGILIEPATGMRVQGYVADDQGVIDINQGHTDISVPVGGEGISSPTTTATFIGNLNPTEDPASPGKTVIRTFNVVDSLGTEQEVTLTFVKDLVNLNTWQWQAEYDGTVVGGGAAADIIFNADGSMDVASTEASSPTSITIPAALMNVNGTQPDPLTVDLDLDSITQLANGDDLGSDFTMQNQDGFTRGVLERFTIAGNGEINGIFSNGLVRTIAQVALATFSNVGALQREGNNLFLNSPASGTPQVGQPESGGRGSVAGGVLENSNVDLGSEFSNLIITQRGYQANARTITAADTVMQETVNLVR